MRTTHWLTAVLLSTSCGLGMSTALADGAQVSAYKVERFIETHDYRYLSENDRAIWSDREWQSIQGQSYAPDEPRLSAEHDLHALEQFVRQQVKVEVVDSAVADDGSYRVRTVTHYPRLLNAFDDYVETESSVSYEVLLRYQQKYEQGELSAANLDIHTHELPWRVVNNGVFVNAAEIQQNRDELHAQGY